MKENIRTLMKGKLIPAILSIVLGIVLIIARRAALDVLVKIVRILIAVAGLAFIIAYFVRGDSNGKLQLTVGPAAVAVIFGIVLFFCASAVVDFFPILMGVIVVIFGVLIVLRPGFVADAVMVFIGAFFIVNGLFDLFIVKRYNDSNLVE